MHRFGHDAVGVLGRAQSKNRPFFVLVFRLAGLPGRRCSQYSYFRPHGSVPCRHSISRPQSRVCRGFRRTPERSAVGGSRPRAQDPRAVLERGDDLLMPCVPLRRSLALHRALLSAHPQYTADAGARGHLPGAGKAGARLAAVLSTTRVFDPVAFIDDKPGSARPPRQRHQGACAGKIVRADQGSLDRPGFARDSINVEASTPGDPDRAGTTRRPRTNRAGVRATRDRPCDGGRHPRSRCLRTPGPGCGTTDSRPCSTPVSATGSSSSPAPAVRSVRSCAGRSSAKIRSASSCWSCASLRCTTSSANCAWCASESQINLAVELIGLIGNAHHRFRVREIFQTYNVQTVYHAAAYKHLPIVEHNIIEGIHNNVIATWHAAEAAHETGVETFLLVSTDKAVNPTNVMGATKRFAEVVLQGLQLRGSKTRFCMVRFGNVLASSGSVVPLFNEQIKGGGTGDSDPSRGDPLLHDDPGGRATGDPGRLDGGGGRCVRPRHGQTGSDRGPGSAHDQPHGIDGPR